MFSDWYSTGFEFYYHWSLLLGESRGGGGGYLLPKPQGIVGSALSLDHLTHLASLLEGHATSIHLEGLPRGRVNRWLSPRWLFLGGKRSLVPQFRQVSSQQAFRNI